MSVTCDVTRNITRPILRPIIRDCSGGGGQDRPPYWWRTFSDVTIYEADTPYVIDTSTYVTQTPPVTLYESSVPGINATSGLFTLASVTPGTYPVTISATNPEGGPTSSNEFTVTILAGEQPLVPQFTPIPNYYSTYGRVGSGEAVPANVAGDSMLRSTGEDFNQYLINPPVTAGTWMVEPSNVVDIDPNTGIVTARPDVGVGVYTMQVSVENPVGRGYTEVFSWEVLPAEGFHEDLTKPPYWNDAEWWHFRNSEAWALDHYTNQPTYPAQYPMLTGGGFQGTTYTEEGVTYGVTAPAVGTHGSTANTQIFNRWPVCAALPDRLANNVSLEVTFQIETNPLDDRDTYSSILGINGYTNEEPVFYGGLEIDTYPGVSGAHMRVLVSLGDPLVTYYVLLDYSAHRGGAGLLPTDVVNIRCRKMNTEASLGESAKGWLYINGVFMSSAIADGDCTADFRTPITRTEYVYTTPNTITLQTVRILPYAATDTEIEAWEHWQQPVPIVTLDPVDISIGVDPIAPATIVSQPVSETVAVGAATTVSVGVAGDPPFTYVWEYRQNGSPTWLSIASFPGGTTGSDTNSLKILSMPSGTVDIQVTVDNERNIPETSSVATLTAYTPIVSTSFCLLFSDLVDGNHKNWDGSATKGAAVTLWGKGFGTDKSKLDIKVGGVSALQADMFAPKPSLVPWIDMVEFHLNSSMPLGPQQITITHADTGVTTADIIDFTVRDTGRILFFDAGAVDANGDGSLSNPYQLPGQVMDYSHPIEDRPKPGDHYYLREGTTYIPAHGVDDSYVLFFYGDRCAKAEPGNSISFSSYPGEFAVLNGYNAQPGQVITRKPCIAGFQSPTGGVRPTDAKDSITVSKMDVYGQNASMTFSGGDNIRGIGLQGNGCHVSWGSGDFGWGGPYGNNNAKVLGCVSRNSTSGYSTDHAFYPGGGAEYVAPEFAYNYIYGHDIGPGAVIGANHDQGQGTEQRIYHGASVRTFSVHHNIFDLRSPNAEHKSSKGITANMGDGRDDQYLAGGSSDPDAPNRWSDPLMVYNNIFISDSTCPRNYYQVSAGGAVKETRVENNISINCGDAGGFNISYSGATPPDNTGFVCDIYIRNNLTLTNNVANDYANDGLQYPKVVVMSGNVYYGGDPNTVLSHDTAHREGIDPLLTYNIDDLSTPWSLGPASPCAGFGSDVGNVNQTRDLNGVPYNNEFDSGAIQADDPLEHMTHIGTFQGDITPDPSPSNRARNSEATRQFALSNAKNSMFILGKRITGRSSDAADCYIGEWSIPGTLAPPEERDLANIPLATKLQDYRLVTDFDNLQNTQSNDPDLGHTNALNGICATADGRLIVTTFDTYDGTYEGKSFCVMFDNAADLANSGIHGIYAMENSAYINGHFVRVPAEHQATFGNWLIASNNGYGATNARFSLGPAMAPFDPDTIVATPASYDVPEPQRVLGYPYDYQEPPRAPWIQGDYVNTLNPDFTNYNEVVNEWSVKAFGAGAVFLPNSNTVMVIGVHSGGLGSRICYKDTYKRSREDYPTDPLSPDNACQWVMETTYKDQRVAAGEITEQEVIDNWIPGIGYHAADVNDIGSYYWLYSIDTLLQVMNGQIQEHEARPYKSGYLDLPFTSNAEQPFPGDPAKYAGVGGVDYDETNDRLYLAIDFAGAGASERPPVYLVYSLKETP